MATVTTAAPNIACTSGTPNEFVVDAGVLPGDEGRTFSAELIFSLFVDSL